MCTHLLCVQGWSISLEQGVSGVILSVTKADIGFSWWEATIQYIRMYACMHRLLPHISLHAPWACQLKFHTNTRMYVYVYTYVTGLLAAVGLLLLAMVATFSVAFIYEQISLYPQFPGLWWVTCADTDPWPSGTVCAHCLLSLCQYHWQLSLCTLRLDLLAESNTTAAAEPPSLVTHTLDNTIYFFSGRSSVLVTVWQAMAVVRAVCCLSAWLVIACLNDYDRLDGETLVFSVVKLCFTLQSTASTTFVPYGKWRLLWNFRIAFQRDGGDICLLE